jgi:hypothetical protein
MVFEIHICAPIVDSDFTDSNKTIIANHYKVEITTEEALVAGYYSRLIFAEATLSVALKLLAEIKCETEDSLIEKYSHTAAEMIKLEYHTLIQKDSIKRYHKKTDISKSFSTIENIAIENTEDEIYLLRLELERLKKEFTAQ